MKYNLLCRFFIIVPKYSFIIKGYMLISSSPFHNTLTLGVFQNFLSNADIKVWWQDIRRTVINIKWRLEGISLKIAFYTIILKQLMNKWTNDWLNKTENQVPCVKRKKTARQGKSDTYSRGRDYKKNVFKAAFSVKRSPRKECLYQKAVKP